MLLLLHCWLRFFYALLRIGGLIHTHVVHILYILHTTIDYHGVRRRPRRKQIFTTKFPKDPPPRQIFYQDNYTPKAFPQQHAFGPLFILADCFYLLVVTLKIDRQTDRRCLRWRIDASQSNMRGCGPCFPNAAGDDDRNK